MLWLNEKPGSVDCLNADLGSGQTSCFYPDLKFLNIIPVSEVCPEPAGQVLLLARVEKVRRSAR